MWQSLPEFGSLVLYAVLVSCAYTFAVAIAASRDRLRWLRSARLGAYATSAFVGVGVSMLAYAFVTHDFRIRYVAHYSDRSMSMGYLFAALWGGQDGSLLWWSALLAVYIAVCVRWMQGRYRVLQPIVIATLAAVEGFFAVLMLFAANPFQVSLAGAPAEGEGLNPLLQNYWMIIHPPALYTGFVGCTVPFAFAVAALVTGRLHEEWLLAVRKWMLFAWLALSIGNVLGMVWAYEELGWGGFWAWDAVENAAALPWFTATAFLHSTMIQERRGMLKIWNIFLIGLTFFLTIFGTFLTRSGLISSVHSFAQSDIGIFFVWFLGLVMAVTIGLVLWRLPAMRGQGRIESLLSREAAFVLNNWALVGLMFFIMIATLFPKLSEWVWRESVVVGPPFFNRWAAPLGLIIFFLMGASPLLGWRRTSVRTLKKNFIAPGLAMVTIGALHVALGSRWGCPAFVARDITAPGLLGIVTQKLASSAPLITVVLAAMNIAVITQEVVLGLRARLAASVQRDAPESILVGLSRLIAKNRRRYGGYVVHLGITAMFIGFLGTVWSLTREASLTPGQSVVVGDFTLTYTGPRMCPGSRECSDEENADTTKRMVFADMQVKKGSRALGRLSPAKFIYHRMPGSPTTEVGLRRALLADLYVVVGSANAETKRAEFQVHVNPLVSWIWIGVLVLILGTSVSIWPEVSWGALGVWVLTRSSLRVEAANPVLESESQ
jgi:cytochrome c-type biogenesis protein CcmF